MSEKINRNNLQNSDQTSDISRLDTALQGVKTHLSRHTFIKSMQGEDPHLTTWTRMRKPRSDLLDFFFSYPKEQEPVTEGCKTNSVCTVDSHASILLWKL